MLASSPDAEEHGSQVLNSPSPACNSSAAMPQPVVKDLTLLLPLCNETQCVDASDEVSNQTKPFAKREAHRNEHQLFARQLDPGSDEVKRTFFAANRYLIDEQGN